MPNNRPLPYIGFSLIACLLFGAWQAPPEGPQPPAATADSPQPTQPPADSPQTPPAAEAAPVQPPAPPAPAAATSEPPAPTPAEATIDAALEKIKALQFISARLTQSSKFLGQQLLVEGEFYKAPDHKIYTLLKLTGLSDLSGTMLQVSDGLTMYEYKKILDSSDVRKRSIQPIFEKLDNPDCDPEMRRKAMVQMGFAGPESLLGGLRKACEFNQLAPGEVDGKKVWIVRGRWKDRASLSGPDQPPLPPTGPLPPYVPSLVSIWLGQEDGWPYRVDLYGQSLSLLQTKKDLREIGPDGRPIGRAMSTPDQPPTEIRLLYTDVKLNEPIPDEQFAWTPPDNIQIFDETQPIVADLSTAIDRKAAEREAELDRKEPELPPIPVPKPPTEGEQPPPIAPIPTAPSGESPE